jgi:hypothetical protein
VLGGDGNEEMSWSAAVPTTGKRSPSSSTLSGRLFFNIVDSALVHNLDSSPGSNISTGDSPRRALAGCGADGSGGESVDLVGAAAAAAAAAAADLLLRAGGSDESGAGDGLDHILVLP